MVETDPPAGHRSGDGAVDQAIIDAVGDATYQLDLDGNFVAVNDVVVEETGYAREELIGEPVTRLLDDADVERSVAAIRELLAGDGDEIAVVELAIHTADGRAVPVEVRIALLRSEGAVVGTVGVARDVSDRKRREEQLERQRNELAELNRINNVIRDVNRALVAATTREEIERAVCERLAESDAYVLAWIGDTRPGGREVEPRARAGVEGSYLEAITVTADDRATGQGPTGRAIRSGEVHVARDLREDPDYAPWREQATDRGFESSAAIPISYGDTVYGVLNLYADRTCAFTDREIAVLDELGETVGLAINAVESKKLLHADTAVELEFAVDDPGSFFTLASRELACEIELHGVVPTEGNVYLYYVSVSGAAPGDVLELADRVADILGGTVVSEHGEESLLLFEVRGSSAVRTLIEAGARVTAASARAGNSTIVVEVAPDTDTSAIVDTVRRVFPDSDLAAKREVERPVQTQREFRDAVNRRLTERQRAVLEAAYRGGYFARPRSVSGSDLAELFDVTPSTFHQHLQTGLDKVVGAVFDESTDG